MWNNSDLVQPPVTTEVYFFKEVNIGLMREARSQLHEAAELLRNQQSLHFEQAILSRLYYKFKNQWRREKCLLNIKQLENYLKKFESMNLESRLECLKELMPSHINSKDERIYLPSVHLVIYTLLRLLGSILLLSKIINICLTAYRNLAEQMSAGLFLTYMMIMTATVARIWILCKSLVNHLIECYNHLYNWSECLKSSATILSSELLPSNVHAWLKLKMPSYENDVTLTNCDNRDITRSKETIEVTEDIGQVVERNMFRDEKIERADEPKKPYIETKDGKEMKPWKISTESAEIKILTNRSKVVGKVKKFLNIDPENLSVNSEKSYEILTKLETRKLLSSVQECSSTSELRLFVNKLNESYPGKSFRGLKKCLKQLKLLKRSSHNLTKSKFQRKRANAEILREGQDILEKFVMGNSVLNLERNVTGKAISICNKNIENLSESNDIPPSKKLKVKYFVLPKRDKLAKFIYSKLEENKLYLEKMKRRLVKRKGTFKYGKRKVKFNKKNLELVLQVLNDESKNKKCLSVELSNIFKNMINKSNL